MADTSTVNELVLRWQELREQGQAVSAEELCADCPALLDDLRRQLEALRSMEQFLGATGDTPSSAARPDAPTVRAGEETAAAAGEVPLVGSRYRPLRLHARGGLGEVYLARDEELSREVALKRLRRPHAADAGRRFLREGEITGGLEHPGVVPVYGLTRDADGQPCYAMRFIRGQTLEEAIARFHETGEAGRGLALRQLLGRFVAVCNTIAYAHSRGVVHRDLKPANIMLGDYGETLVVDWGLAKRLGGPGEAQPDNRDGASLPPADGRDSGTAIGDVLGTPQFMSPEQATGRQDTVGPASDIYGLGATLYALLTGRPPFTCDSVAEVLRQVQRGGFPPPRLLRPQTPRALAAICLKAMAREPEARYATALEMAADVERWLADESVRAYPEPIGARARRWVRRHRTLVTTLLAVLGLTVLLGGGTAGWLAARQAETNRSARDDLEEADGFQREEKWTNAKVAAQRAQARIGSSGPAELREQARQAHLNLALVERLEEIFDDFSSQGGEDRAKRVARMETAFAEAFSNYGWDLSSLATDEAAQRVHASAIQSQLLAGLEQWAVFREERNGSGGDKLLAIIAAVDPDPWRNELRQARVRWDRAALSRLVAQADVPQLPLASLLSLGRMASSADNSPGVLRVLKAAQRRAPGDLWINYTLGYKLRQAQQFKAEAVGYLRAALAMRPGNVVLRWMIAEDLEAMGRLQEALETYQDLLRDKPDCDAAHSGLGWTLVRLGRLDQAEAEFRKALDYNSKNAWAHNNLGYVLAQRGQFDEALAHDDEAVRLQPDLPYAHVNRAVVLLRKQRPAEAEAAARKATEVDAELALGYNFLGLALQAQGKFDDALAAYQTALKKDPAYTEARNNMRSLALDRRLPQVLSGQDKPTDAELIEFARLCIGKKRYSHAAQFFEAAFAAQPRLAEDLRSFDRYNAACAAAQAAGGSGGDATRLDDAERARLRGQALGWLRADLGLWAKQLEAGTPEARKAVREQLQNWRRDTDLAGLRDAAALAKLPEVEREACLKLWADVDALLLRADGDR
jgi:serine/threonine-protein kinase